MDQFVCNACGSNTYQIVWKARGIAKTKYLVTDDAYGVHGQVISCNSCKLVSVYPRESITNINKRYSKFIDPVYEMEIHNREHNYKQIVNQLGKVSNTGGKLLDIGCATGGLLRVAKDQGWQVFGIEPSIWAVKIARQKNLVIKNSPLESANFTRSLFDVITCVDVIEHVVSPKKLLLLAHKWLKPKGTLCIVTPDKDSLLARMLGENWWHVRPDHIYYFSQTTLTAMLIRTGFKIEKVYRYSWTFSFSYWTSRLKSQIPVLHKLLTNFDFLNNLKVTLNLGDSLEIYCRKV